LGTYHGHSGGGGFVSFANRVRLTRALDKDRTMTLGATEADLKERGIVPPPRPLSQAAVFWLGFLCGAAVISFPWFIFWELT
jgi:hypothetical protein